MKTGDLASGPARLFKAWQKLNMHWDETRQLWHDPVSLQFEQTYLHAWEPQLATTLERMRALAGQLNTAERECDS